MREKPAGITDMYKLQTSTSNRQTMVYIPLSLSVRVAKVRRGSPAIEGSSSHLPGVRPPPHTHARTHIHAEKEG